MLPRCKEMASRLAEQRSVTDFASKSVTLHSQHSTFADKLCDQSWL